MSTFTDADLACFCGTDQPLGPSGRCPGCGRGAAELQTEARRVALIGALGRERAGVAAAGTDPDRLASIDVEVARLESLGPKP